MKIIIGDNPFFGVNHKVGSKKLASKTERFKQASEVIREFKINGVEEIMVSNHPSLQSFLDTVPSCDIHFVIPYPHKYNDIVAVSGYFGLIRYFLRGFSLQSFHKILFNFIRLDFNEIFIRLMIASELKCIGKYKNRVKSLCLHNILVDLCIASGNVSILKSFHKICKELRIRPVFITQNIRALIESMPDIDYTGCFSFNSKGYMVNPSIDEVLSYLNKNTNLPKLWAMQIMASGSINNDEAIQFISKFNYFEKVLYATTKKQRVTDFVSLFKKYY